MNAFSRDDYQTSEENAHVALLTYSRSINDYMECAGKSLTVSIFRGNNVRAKRCFWTPFVTNRVKLHKDAIADHSVHSLKLHAYIPYLIELLL